MFQLMFQLTVSHATIITLVDYHDGRLPPRIKNIKSTIVPIKIKLIKERKREERAEERD